jgi:ribosomal protein L14
VTLFKFTCSKKVKKRTIYLGLIVGISYWTTRIDGSYIKFFSNRLLVFNKSYKFLGTRVYGAILKEIRLKSIKDKNYRKFFQKLISYSSLIV